jgi:Tol biopolymer transport system component
VAALTLPGCAFVERVDLRSDGATPSAAAEAGHLSADGRFVAFGDCVPLVPDDQNGTCDTYVRDVRDDTTERVSVGTAGGDADGQSTPYGISGDGRYVLFLSDATNLVPGGTTGENLFVRDRTAGTTALVTVTTDGQAPNRPPGNASLSANGRVVVFESEATNLLAGTVADRESVYVRDLVAGTTERASVDDSGVAANDHSASGGVSADGNLVVFESTATNLPGAQPATSYNRVYVRNRSAGTTTLVSAPLSGNVDGGSIPADHAISTNGRYVLFNSWANGLTVDDPAGTTDVYVRDLQTNTTSLVYAPTGVPAHGDPVPLIALNPVGISDDGRYVVINGLRSGDITHLTDFQAYVIDRAEQRITLVRIPGGRPYTEPVRAGSISADGGYLTYGTSDPAGAGSFVRSTSQPLVLGTAPAVLTRGTTTGVTVTGTHFVDGAVFDFGPGTTVDAVSVTDAQHADVSVTVAAGATPGPRMVTVIAPGTGPGPGSGGLGFLPVVTIAGTT